MSKIIKRILFTICIILFCFSDQRIASQTGDAHLLYSALPSLALGLLILFRYPIRDFLKIPYYILAAIWLFLFPTLLKWGWANTYYPGQWLVHMVIFVLFSFILLRTFWAYVIEKQKPSSWPILLAAFFVMLILIYTSRYDYKWTIFYISLFMFLYLTNFTREERGILLLSLQDGIIIAFLLIQGTAFLFRPYDTLRYLGQYANTNMNALFYQSVYCAFLSRFCIMEVTNKKLEKAHLQQFDAKQPKHTWNLKKIGFLIMKWVYFALAACMWPFVFLTMCRSAMMGMGIATILGLAYCIRYANRKRLLLSVKYVFSLLVLIIAGFPVVYCAVRYIPPLFHHPVYYVDEYSEEKILYDDPWDSPKYTDWEDILTENFGRIADLIQPLSQSSQDSQTSTPVDGIPENNTDKYQENMEVSGQANAEVSGQANTEVSGQANTEVSGQADMMDSYLDNTKDSDQADAKASWQINAKDLDKTDTKVSGQVNIEDSENKEENFQDFLPASNNTENDQTDSPILKLPAKSTSIRMEIYKFYFHSLNGNGHKEAEHGVHFEDGYFAPHAHNLLLQFAFNFGIPFGILFILFLAATGIKLLIDSFREPKPTANIIPLLLYASIIVFGMTEVMWRNGQLSYVLLFLLPFIAWQYKPGSDAPVKSGPQIDEG